MQDEVKDYGRYESFTFVDMLEGLGRMADKKCIPSMIDISDAGYQNVFEWAVDKEQKGEEGEKTNQIFKSRPSADLGTEKTRPLVGKLDCLLELVFRRLYHDPLQPDNEFSLDAVLKMIKKLDKGLGP